MTHTGILLIISLACNIKVFLLVRSGQHIATRNGYILYASFGQLTSGVNKAVYLLFCMGKAGD